MLQRGRTENRCTVDSESAAWDKRDGNSGTDYRRDSVLMGLGPSHGQLGSCAWLVGLPARFLLVLVWVHPLGIRWEAVPMKKGLKRGKANRAKTKLGLPDLEHVKSSVLVSLRSPESQRSYRRSIEDFVAWYCSEPRLSFSKTVVTRYRIHLEDRLLAPSTINVRLAAVRRLAHEAAHTGLLSPDLAAGIRRVRGARKLGTRLGNWLTADEGRSLWQLPDQYSIRGKRDRAILAVLLGCGLRRRELRTPAAP